MAINNNALTELRDSSNDRWETKCTYIAVGTGTNTSTSSDTTLQTEVLRKAVETITRDDANGKITIPMHILSTEANGSVLTEVGLFSAISGGTMYFRALITEIIKEDNKEGWIDVQITNLLSLD